MMTCRCGGFFTLDRSHISAAERFGCLETAPLLWKCCLCGRSRWLEQSAAVRVITPEPVEVRPVGEDLLAGRIPLRWTRRRER